MATGVPGEEIELWQVQLVHQVRNAPGMLVATMEQQDRLAWLRPGGTGRGPMPIEKLYAVMGTEGVLLLFAHRKILMPSERCRIVL